MSNSLGNSAVQQSLYCLSIMENQTKAHRWISTHLSREVPSCYKNYYALQRMQKAILSTGFFDNKLNSAKRKLWYEMPMAAYASPHAMPATDPYPKLGSKFKLDANSELQVTFSYPKSGPLMQIDFQITNSSDSLVLHWGAVRLRNNDWCLPSHYPNGTKVYQNSALRTPFVKHGSNSSLKIEIDDPELQAIEFVVFDEAGNKWLKNDGQNFHIQLLRKSHQTLDDVPEDLVQVHAYLRWEKKGKQAYTPEQEKEEYESARNELFQEMKRGTSVEELRARLNKRTDSIKEKVEENNCSHEVEIPNDLVQVQAYIRWEKDGKPTYSAERQILEFEEARKELQMELAKGMSLGDIRKKIMKGNTKEKVSKQLKNKKYFATERVRIKNRDLMQFINKYSSQPLEGKSHDAKKSQTAIELWSKAIEERYNDLILTEKHFKVDNFELKVFVNNPKGELKVHLGTNYEAPLVLHWALSEKAREWKAPPSNTLPLNSVLLDMACETSFDVVHSAEPAYELQIIEIDVSEGCYDGMLFVLRSDGHWIKNNGADFYVEFSGRNTKSLKGAGEGKGTAKALLDSIVQMESDAERSLMHRFNIAADLIEQAKGAGKLGFAGILVWMRFMATRQLVWNKNYNVKPREISKAQDRLNDLLGDAYRSFPQYREILRIIMSIVGRGGEGDVGQRIRDEILVIQRNNDCKGGMMEEWHQKLHNNTSPDDVVICQALIDYVNNNFDVNFYWKTLNENGITKERLLSYDRAIHSEPNFRPDQKEGLLRDLENYLKTLKAVHSGADLESAIATCLGYKSEGEGFMVGVQINPISGLPSGFLELLEFILDHIEDKVVEPLLEGLLEARAELHPLLLNSHERFKDLIFLDIALDSAVRTTVERGYEELNNADPQKIMYFISLVLQNLALTSVDNENLVFCLKGWKHALDLYKKNDNEWALLAKSFLDRTQLALSSKAEYFHEILQPSAEYLGSLLGVDQWAVNIFTEEIIRAGSAASLSALLNRIDPVLRKVAHLGSWQVISPFEVTGYIVSVNELLSVQNKSYERPTILVAKNVKGEEEIPDGTVAVLTPDKPDVLSHVSVRARNSKICFATCFDPKILTEFERNEGKLFSLKPTSADIIFSEISEDELRTATSKYLDERQIPQLTVVQKEFAGRYAIMAEEFTSEMVGAKSRNISYLRGKVPSWVGIPTSVAIPFGVFEKVLTDNSINKDVADNLSTLKKRLAGGDISALGEIRNAVLRLAPPQELEKVLEEKMKISGIPWPGDEGEDRWQEAWNAIKKVWASKWNERAYISTRKAKLNHDHLCMAVLIQEIINADYAFVIHTTNPSSRESSEIYAEVVKGLGETLVGAYPGRALSFVCKKKDLDSPKVLGFPSKPIGLFIRRSIIFRSDSNGEDLEGYAGAGLYDSVPMDDEEAMVLDYTSDPLVTDRGFRRSILSSIARAGMAIEELYKSPQDIEGVIKDGKIYVVQTRPQM
ncbi:hypothetical protein HPP92_002680 [Vanilla planifolia]|uniref:Pyruvate phosphate dikinase AMP/ATP-binding domain-containing protein n=1 Tax=Vanilla planifolia TaxID=51239 RepID=A0A835SF55_VANPL|nr:hypothetical protein HPP92_002680 [Vanilla planifolia]